mmetsp:Transcript_17722/g.24414  ORF Transcript_17722/g.24414 Transcript_17722/m.24414 type:complete len:121 (-) Transcript_17722:55-417(-)
MGRYLLLVAALVGGTVLASNVAAAGATEHRGMLLLMEPKERATMRLPPVAHLHRIRRDFADNVVLDVLAVAADTPRRICCRLLLANICRIFYYVLSLPYFSSLTGIDCDVANDLLGVRVT